MFFVLCPSFAQQIVRSTIGSVGSTMTSEKMSIQQTIGQPSVTITATNEKGVFLRQGFLQPVIIESLSNELNVQIFPNPNTGSFQFIADVSSNVSFDYTLTDVNGKVILFGEGKGNLLQSLVIDQPSNGMYFLNIVGDSSLSSFKINVINN
jgi:hypothetical protein